MRAVADVESAIQQLSAEQPKELAAWFEEYQQMISASAEVFALYDKEEENHC